ncbi:MAG: ATP-binding protein [Cyanobacteria bacterium]|nr:ATP-binding protein [Cyanobacteriota bacterium]MDW8202827.1 ATP-binding protein [Cyanobacteriota bacterium SKYGB_h_bin112]
MLTAHPKILVVEDEAIVAKAITSQLRQLGYVVADTASSGVAAIAKFAETQPDLVLMDVVLKGDMDGVETAAQIREQRDVPIVYLTAYADDNTLQRAKVTNPFGYIVKPFTSNDLRVAIEIALFRHRVAQELQENRDQLATLLRSMSDAVVATDSQGQITFMNPAAEALTGWQQDEAIGKPVTQVMQLIDEVTEHSTEHPVLKVLQNQEIAHLQDLTALVAKNGDRIPIGDSASPLKRSTGEFTGAVIVFWDMRDRRRAERLSQALAKEQELNRLKSQFISTISHEFRNPLAVIRTATELLERSQNLSPEKQLSYIQRIKTSVRALSQLMEDVLIMGQAEADRLTCNPAQLDLLEFCQSLAEEFSIVEGNVCAIHFAYHGDCTVGYLDERLLRYILTNLLSNAIKYSPPASRIEFMLTTDLRSNTASFQIQDYGIGIPAEDQGRLFESFFRGSNVKSIQGTGLGLAIVQRCVAAHRGHVQLESQVGVGTTVTVTLPLQSPGTNGNQDGNTEG